MREIEKNAALEDRITHEEIVFKEKRNQMLDKLNRKDQEIDGYDLTERLGQIKNDFYDKFDMLKVRVILDFLAYCSNLCPKYTISNGAVFKLIHC